MSTDPWSPFLNPNPLDKETDMIAREPLTVNVSLTLATDEPPDVVLRSVVDAVGEHQLPVIGSHVYVADDLVAGPEVQLLACDGQLLAAYVDRPDRALEHARDVGAVVVNLRVDDDYRKPTSVASHGGQDD